MIITLDNKISRIWDRLYVGNFQAAVEVELNNPHDIGWVLNCTPNPIIYSLEGSGIASKILNIDDGMEVNPEKIALGLDWIRFGLGMGCRVLVHCHAGMSRSASFAAAFMYQVGFKDFDGCVDVVKQRRPVAQPHPLVLRSFKKYFKVYPYDGSFGDV